MIFKSIYIKGFTPFALPNIDSILIESMADLVLILGSNGCGKSSLLREINGFPANSADYRDGGEKRVVIEHNGDEYILISTIKRGSKHTAIKNGIEVHSNVISSLQREYVIKEFGYTPLINKLLIGDLKFTSMTPQARRELLTTISPLDLDYAIKVHGAIKEELRDNMAIIKHLVAKSGEARSKLRELNISEDMETRKTEIEARINTLLPFATRIIDGEDQNIEYEIDNNYNKLTVISQKLDRFDNRRIPIDGIATLEELSEYIGTLSGKLSATQMNINNLNSEIQSINELSDGLLDNAITPENLRSKLNYLESELSNHQNDYGFTIHHDKFLDAADDLFQQLDNVYGWLGDAIIYSDDDEQALKLQYQSLLTEQGYLKQVIDNNEIELKHLHDPEAIIKCPKCEFSFNIKGLSVEDNIRLIQEKITVDYNRLMSIEKELNELKKPIEDIDLVQKLSYKLLDIHRSDRWLVKIWEQFPNNKEVLTNATKMRNSITKFKAEVLSSLKRTELLSEIKTCGKSLELQSKYGNGLNERLASLHNNVEQELFNLRQLEKDIEYSKNLYKYITYFNKLEESSNQILNELETNFKIAIDKSIKQDARKQCDDLYNELALNTSILNKYNSLISTISEMENEYETLTTRQAHLSILEEHLSHNKGLIADQMLGFIGSYIEQINLICKEIWGYRLELKMCHMDNGQLDYTFPLLVEDETIPDIGKGSTAQVDMVDFAFVLVMRQYLELNNYPLFMDELGSSFDPTHRRTLMDYIKAIQGTNVCSQIFMINHYQAVYGGLTNHDTIVLDSRNVPVPANANINVKITYR